MRHQFSSEFLPKLGVACQCVLNVVARLAPSYSCYYYVDMEEYTWMDVHCIFILSLSGAALPKHQFFFSLVKFLWLTFLQTVISIWTILLGFIMMVCQMSQNLKWISQVDITIIYNFECCIPVCGGSLPLLFVCLYLTEVLLKLWPEEA